MAPPRITAFGLGAFAVALLAVLTTAEAAPAAEAESSWLSWRSPVECQNTAEVERQIESLLGRAVDFAELPATRVEHAWSHGKGWTLVVRVTLPAGERTRRVNVRTCAAGLDVVAISRAFRRRWWCPPTARW